MHKNPFARGRRAHPGSTVRRYFARQRTHGKSMIARVLDFCLLLVVVFIGAVLFLCSKGIHVRHALLLAGIAALFTAVLYRIYVCWALQRFMPKEMRRLAKVLLQRRMPFFDRAVVRSLCQKAAGIDDPVVFCTVEAVGADMLLPYLAASDRKERILCSVAGFTKTAQLLADGQTPAVKLIGKEPLLDAALQNPDLCPAEEEIYRLIESEEAERKQRRKRARAFPFDAGARRYLIAAAILFLFSTGTGYVVYYRMLASLCMTLAVLRILLRRNTHKEQAV